MIGVVDTVISFIVCIYIMLSFVFQLLWPHREDMCRELFPDTDRCAESEGAYQQYHRDLLPHEWHRHTTVWCRRTEVRETQVDTTVWWRKGTAVCCCPQWLWHDPLWRPSCGKSLSELNIILKTRSTIIISSLLLLDLTLSN